MVVNSNNCFQENMSEENQMCTLDFPVFEFALGSFYFLVVTNAILSIWSRSRSDGVARRLPKLRFNAEKLRLEINRVSGDSMYEAIADQMKILNPRDTFTSNSVRNRVNRNGRRLQSYTSYERIAIWDTNRSWKRQIIVLHVVADLFKTTVEVVHDDRMELTTIRPNGINVADAYYSLPTIYLGYLGKNRFCSLMPTCRRSAKKHTRKYNKETVRRNFLIGDNSQQYSIHFPSDDDHYEINTQNIVIGDNSSQNILVTLRTSKEMVKFLQNMQSSGVEGSGHSLRLKIRQRSDTLTDEQMKENEKRITELLQDDTSELRNELEESLKDFGLLFEKATQGCILLYLSPVSSDVLHDVVKQFQCGDFKRIIRNLALRQFIVTNKVPSSIDVQLQLYMNLSERERSLIGNLDRIIVRDRKGEEKRNEMSPGISLFLRQPNKTSREKSVFSNKMSDNLSLSTLERLGKTGVFDETVAISVSLEKFGSGLHEVGSKSFRRSALQNASNEMLEAVQGSVGVVSHGHKAVGTCFRVGQNYIMTAFHVVENICEANSFGFPKEEELFVNFKDVELKYQTKVVYFDKEIDVAVLKLSKEHSSGNPFKRIGKCHAGYPFYTVGYQGSSRTIKRSVVLAQCLKTKQLPVHLVLFDSDLFDYGSSGSPGIVIKGGETSVVTMLLGSLNTERKSWYCGVRMDLVYESIKSKAPTLANKLFG